VRFFLLSPKVGAKIGWLEVLPLLLKKTQHIQPAQKKICICWSYKSDYNVKLKMEYGIVGCLAPKEGHFLKREKEKQNKEYLDKEKGRRTGYKNHGWNLESSSFPLACTRCL
jgi:hypothetical protein